MPAVPPGSYVNDPSESMIIHGAKAMEKSKLCLKQNRNIGVLPKSPRTARLLQLFLALRILLQNRRCCFSVTVRNFSQTKVQLSKLKLKPYLAIVGKDRFD